MKIIKKQVLFIVFLLTIICCGQKQDNKKQNNEKQDNRGYKVKVGEQAPPLSFTLLDGQKITNKSLLGKTVVLQFTASWCGVCIEEMPHLEKEVWQKFKNDDFILIGIDLKEDLETTKQFIKNTQVTYPFTLDLKGEIFESFTVEGAGVTRNIVIDKTGKIVFLTRLYNRKEFEKMITVIESELEK